MLQQNFTDSNTDGAISRFSVIKLTLSNSNPEEVINQMSSMSKHGVPVYCCSITSTSIDPSVVDFSNTSFSKEYLIYCILSLYRYHTLDIELLKEIKDAPESLLSLLLSKLEGKDRFTDIKELLRKCKERAKILVNVEPKIPPHFTSVRRLIITPTRFVFLPPQPMLSNRCLRKFGAGAFYLCLCVKDY